MANGVLGLTFRLKADSSQAKKELKDFTNTVDKETKDLKAAGSFANLAKQVGLSADQTAKLQTALPIVGAALTAVAGAASAAAVGLFTLTKNASDTGGALIDMSAKSGLSVETLSALNLAASTTDISIEELNQGIIRFSKTLADARDGSEAAKQALVRLGIDPKKGFQDLEGSLKQVFQRISEMKNPTLQLQAAYEVFGRNVGSKFRQVIVETNGDIDALIKRAKELGVLWSTEDARAADEFGDALAQLQLQFQGVANTIAKELFPVFTRTFSQISLSLKNNQAEVQSWAAAISNFVNGINVILQSQLVRVAALVASYTQIGLIIRGIAWLGGKMASEAPAEDVYGPGGTMRGGSKGMKSGSGGGAALPDDFAPKTGGGKASAANEAQQAALASLRAAQEETNRIYQVGVETARRNYEQSLTNATEYYNALREQENKRFENAKADIERELALSKKKESDLIAHNAKIAALNSEHYRNLEQIEDEEKARKLSDLQRLHEQEIRLLAIRTEKEIAVRKIALDEGKISETQYADFVNRQETLLLEDRIQRLKKEAEAAKDSRDARLRIANEIAELQTKLDLQAVTNAERLREARRRENEEIERKKAALDALAPEGPEGAGPSVTPEMMGDVGTPPTGLTIWETTLKNLRAQFAAYIEGVALVRDANNQLQFSFQQVFTSIAELGVNAFTQLAAGFGQLVANWVLYGNQGENSFRKMVAGVLANVAQIATTYAILCLAAAVLASTVFGGALMGGSPAQFLAAAALFAGVAAASAVAGRAVAGTAFQNATGGSGPGGSSPGGAPNNSNFTQNQSTEGVRGEYIFADTLNALNDTLRGFQAVTPGSVLVQGVREERGLIGSTLDDELGSDAALIRSIGGKILA